MDDPRSGPFFFWTVLIRRNGRWVALAEYLVEVPRAK
jgi:hypothetical protein